MRFWVLCGLVLGLALLSHAATPQAFVLDGTTLAPVRVFTDWLGGDVRYDAQAQTVTLTKDSATLQVTANRQAATQQGQPITLPAPAVAIDGVLYVPARTLAAVFGCTLDWKARPATLTMHRDGIKPLVIAAQAFPHPARIDDTLAGLTPGDHLALAVARWGDPQGVGKSAVPGAQNYTFNVDPAGSILLTTTVRQGEIVCIATRLADTPSPILRPYLQQTATGRGVELAGASPRHVYGKPYDGIAVESGDTAIAFYRRRQLKLMARHTFFGETGALTLVELRLMRREFPKAWVHPQEIAE